MRKANTLLRGWRDHFFRSTVFLIFFFFTENGPWKSGDKLSEPFRLEKSKKRHTIWKQAPTVSWHPSARVAVIVELFMFVSNVEKWPSWPLILRVLVSFGRRKPLETWRCKIKKKMDFEQRKQFKPCEDYWVCEHKHRASFLFQTYQGSSRARKR